jgi:ethanolamine ammonia-lyase large subunit
LFRYAVAAAIIGILVVGSFVFTNNGKGEGTPAIATKASNIPVEVYKLSEKEIADYLDNSVVVFDVNSINQGLIEELNVREYIRNISDEDIREYLNQNEQPTNNSEEG